ncbi:MAG: hypothetical protein ACSLE6_05635 [Mycobacterium sp.]
MTTKKAPTTPGQQLVARITNDMAARYLEPSSKEFELLQLAAGLADQLEGLKWKQNGQLPTVSTSKLRQWLTRAVATG